VRSVEPRVLNASSVPVWAGVSWRVLVAARGGPQMASLLRGDLRRVVSEACAFLERHAGREFLFRVPGSKAQVDALVARYERGDEVDLAQSGCGAEEVASLLKRYLSDSDSKVFSKAMVQSLLKHAARFEAGHAKGSAAYLQGVGLLQRELRATLKAMPAESAWLASKVLLLLSEVSRQAASSKMNAYALAVCFAPVFFLHGIATEALATKLPSSFVVVEQLIAVPHELVPGYAAVAQAAAQEPDLAAGADAGAQAPSKRDSTRTRQSLRAIMNDRVHDIRSKRISMLHSVRLGRRKSEFVVDEKLIEALAGEEQRAVGSTASSGSGPADASAPQAPAEPPLVHEALMDNLLAFKSGRVKSFQKRASTINREVSSTSLVSARSMEEAAMRALIANSSSQA
jgi:hypothetical protein